MLRGWLSVPWFIPRETGPPSLRPILPGPFVVVATFPDLTRSRLRSKIDAAPFLDSTLNSLLGEEPEVTQVLLPSILLTGSITTTLLVLWSKR
jgi:hypothetical protein